MKKHENKPKNKRRLHEINRVKSSKQKRFDKRIWNPLSSLSGEDYILNKSIKEAEEINKRRKIQEQTEEIYKEVGKEEFSKILKNNEESFLQLINNTQSRDYYNFNNL